MPNVAKVSNNDKVSIAGWEEQLGNRQRKKTENSEIEPFERVADRSGHHCGLTGSCLRLRERNSRHVGPLAHARLFAAPYCLRRRSGTNPFALESVRYERATGRYRGILRRPADRPLGARRRARRRDPADRRRTASALPAATAVEGVSHRQGCRKRPADPAAAGPGSESHRTDCSACERLRSIARAAP